jgi:hypothetical protein
MRRNPEFGTKIQNALQRILVKVRPQSFDCLEITGIVAMRFLGVSYANVSAHSRHTQPSCYLDGAEERRTVPARRRVGQRLSAFSICGSARCKNLQEAF